jgi:hypothetical protein
MLRAEDYRLRAEQCFRKAQEARDDYHRKNFSRLANMWTEMARKTAAREEFSTTLSQIEQVIARQ